MKPKLALDLDGTIIDTPAAILALLQESGKIDFNISTDDLVHHNFEYFPADPKTNTAATGIKNITRQHIDTIFSNDDFWTNIGIYPEVVPIVQRLAERFEIHIVTAREPSKHNITVDYLSKHQIPFDHIFYCRSKDKWKYVKENQIDYFVEDYEMPANLIAPFTKQTFLVNRPWNQIVPLEDGCIRATWSEIEQVLLGGLVEV